MKNKDLNLPKAEDSTAGDFENVKLSEKVSIKVTLTGPSILHFGDFLKGIGGHNISVGNWVQIGFDGPMFMVHHIEVEKIGDES